MESGRPEDPLLVDELVGEIGELRRALARAGGPLAGLVGRSSAMQELFRAIFHLAERRVPVIVAGEPGSGRTTVAAAIHHLSAQSRKPLRSLVFGIPAGNEDAAIAAASKGAGLLVVKGITHVPLDTQDRVLAASDGSASPRLVIVSPRDPAAAVAERKLHPAIFERADRVVVAPLREKRDDIPLLAEYFLRPLDFRERAAALDPKALEAMAAHEWAGNVRELRNVIRRARALSDGPVIGLTAIQSVLGGVSARLEGEAGEPAEKEIVSVRVGDSMADIERRVLQRTLRFAKGNKRKAAEMLKLSLKTIYNKVKEYGLEREFNRRFRKEPRSE